MQLSLLLKGDILICIVFFTIFNCFKLVYSLKTGLQCCGYCTVAESNPCFCAVVLYATVFASEGSDMRCILYHFELLQTCFYFKNRFAMLWFLHGCWIHPLLFPDLCTAASGEMWGNIFFSKFLLQKKSTYWLLDKT
jgi:hypothetical protein